jgi:hypothetical protein
VAENVVSPIGSHPDRYLAYAAAKTAKRKTQASFDVRLDSFDKIDIAGAHRNPHSVFPPRYQGDSKSSAQLIK